VHGTVIRAGQPAPRQPTKEHAVRKKLQLMVAVAASVTVTALAMSALAIGQGQPGTGGETQDGDSDGVAAVVQCLSDAGIAVPDGLDPPALKQWVGQHPDAMHALDGCFPPDEKGDQKPDGDCKAGEPGTIAVQPVQPVQGNGDARSLRAQKKRQAVSSSSLR
jgi:hypothetical protein